MTTFFFFFMYLDPLKLTKQDGKMGRKTTFIELLTNTFINGFMCILLSLINQAGNAMNWTFNAKSLV